NKQTGHTMLDDFGKPADLCRHDGSRRGAGLDRHVPERFNVGWDHHEVAQVEEIPHIVALSDKATRRQNRESAGESLHSHAIGAARLPVVADDQEAIAIGASHESRRHVQIVVDALDLDHLADKSDYGCRSQLEPRTQLGETVRIGCTWWIEAVGDD